jgi:hypothetical protein
LRLQFARIDRVEELPLLHERAFDEVDALEEALRACAYLDLFRAAGLADVFDVDRDVLLNHRCNFDFRRSRRRRCFLLAGGQDERRDGECGDERLRDPHGGAAPSISSVERFRGYKRRDFIDLAIAEYWESS